MALEETLSNYLKAYAYESITVANTAIGFTVATYLPDTRRPPGRAVLSLETAQIRYRYDGTNPTSTEGHLMDVGDKIVIEGYENIRNFRAIRTGETSGVLKITYERI